MVRLRKENGYGGAMIKEYSVKGMVCSNCDRTVENALLKNKSITHVNAGYQENKVEVTYSGEREVNLNVLNSLLESYGYTLSEQAMKQSPLKQSSIYIVGLVTIMIGFLLIATQLGYSIFPDITGEMTYTMLFVAGILTSFHCVAMCGGIALSQSITTEEQKWSKIERSLKYNMGRLVSYTVLGGIIGLIGSVFSMGGQFKGLISVIAGGFMILLSLNMLGVTKLKLPKFRKSNHVKFGQNKNGPILVGLANGFMPCGPLQTMQLYALGTGSLLGGMSAMFFFALGTIPLMLGLGVLTTLMSQSGGRKFVKASSVVVLALGLIMINRGLSLSGYGISLDNVKLPMNLAVTSSKNVDDLAEVAETEDVENALEATVEPEVIPEVLAYEIIDGVQVVHMTVRTDRYVLSSPLVAGMPAKIIMDIEGISRCNSPVLIPKEGLEVDLLRAEPVFEFTPKEVGNLRITCWMGMITTNAEIVESL